MDFKRIEWIFLVVFVAVDIFLGISFYQSQEVDQAVSESTTSEIVQDIKQDQIKLPKLSSTKPTGGYLASQANNALQTGRNTLSGLDTAYASGTLHATLRSPLRLSEDHEKAVAQLRRWMSNAAHVLYGAQYHYATGLSSGGTFVFAQKVGGHLVYDRRAQVTFTVVNDKLVSYTQTYIADMTVLKSNVELISPQEAVVTLYKDNEIPNAATVQWLELAYNYLLDTKGSTVYVPTWFVGVKSQGAKSVTIKKLNAITKTVAKERDGSD
ncbi:two-component system regulatory protein YycI [Lacticaseibacillus jixiensis]|uniref:two-component system regulatory protein YycI n=1 Tax=Lacticaseibacillus jixiensis TaxID=3231926 RepID=UPI0036F36733